ncbi:Iron-sulfur cluster assembly protein SufD [Georgfuchsia toluolica]|uniref:Iron-sulfur cluster assembly protein SufD n=1 Tax=Georgfuchsia toluolica TaxID=424218 RepID=A0A916J1V3_9PROT|nr:Fe-S cluster assembly protein SufD [Georgfuchsia toluolica]CAG4882464.1 Iron-sulfur cluster assembly protein SufD [Georgfuchsia toluolica]
MNVTATGHYLDEFSRAKAALPGSRLPWLAGIRTEAMEEFHTRGFPTLRDEDWKYTSVARIEQGRFSLLSDVTPPVMTKGNPRGTTQQIEALALPEAQLLVFVDGRHMPTLSRINALPMGITIASIADLLAREPETLHTLLARQSRDYSSGFAALNAACMIDGSYLYLAQDTVLDAPLHLLFVATQDNLATHVRNFVVAEANSRACIVEHHVALGAPRYFTNIATDIVAGRGASIEHHKLQEESAKAFHIAATNACLSQDSHFVSASYAFGGALARIDISVALDGEGAECSLAGLYMGDGRQHVDHHTSINHNRPRGTSREFYKGVLSGAARAVFNGKVIVHPGAQHSDALQTNHNLLLSEQAEVDTKPQLEIWADDVKCSHGATVGQLDDNQIFYLRSRGMDDAAARALLTYAFAAELTNRVALAPLRAKLERLLRERLPQSSGMLS